MKTLSLSTYYNNKKYLYYLFDYLINETKSLHKITKNEFLKSVGISYSSYRREKNSKVANIRTIEILENYYGINKLDFESKNNYELILMRIYYNSYYKNDTSFEKYLEKINYFIECNNSLKPIFLLFKLLGYLNLNYSFDKLINELSQDINYLKNISSDYFYDQYEVIYLSIMEYFNCDIDEERLNSLLEIYPEVKWLTYTLKASKNYINKDFSSSLEFLQKALIIYKKDNNIIRTNVCISNIAALYNNTENYLKNILFLRDILKYAYCDENSIWLSNILQHYIHALFMSDRLTDIIELLTSSSVDITKLKSLSMVEILLASNKKHNDLCIKLVKIWNNDSNVNAIINYINTKDKAYFYKLEKTVSFFQLVKKIKNKNRKFNHNDYF